MLIKAQTLNGYKLNAIDGEIGKVKEFYFDDRHWAIRYLVAATGSWLMDKQVLISPYALVGISTAEQHVGINLTKQQIEDSPPLSSDKPVSRQFEQDYYAYYGWPMYWSGRYMWGNTPHVVRGNTQLKQDIQAENAWDPNLRSTASVSGYHIQAADGEIGHVDDFIIDDEAWAIRYLVIDTQNWWPGRKLLISPQWVERVSWSESKVFIPLTRKDIEGSPEYTESSLQSRKYEIELHHHYNRKGYWDTEATPKKHSGSKK